MIVKIVYSAKLIKLVKRIPRLVVKNSSIVLRNYFPYKQNIVGELHLLIEFIICLNLILVKFPLDQNLNASLQSA